MMEHVLLPVDNFCSAQAPSWLRLILPVTILHIPYFCCSRLSGFVSKTKSNKQWLCGISYNYLREPLVHLLIDLDHFLFPSETVLGLSAGARGGRRRRWHQLSKHAASCLHIQTQRKVYGSRATGLGGNADPPSAFTSLIK